LAPAAEGECGIDPAQRENAPAKTGFRPPSYTDCCNSAGEFADMSNEEGRNLIAAIV